MKREAVAAVPPAGSLRKKGPLHYLWRDKSLYLMLLPAVVLIVIFYYVPLYGILYAFQDFTLGSPTWIFDPNVEWVGFKHFIKFFTSQYFPRTFWNTIRNSLLSLTFGFGVPVVFALLINEITSPLYKRVCQTVSYLPHFISSVVVAGLLLGMLSYDDGIVNTLIERLGFERINFFNDPRYFPWILLFSGIWQSFGWNSILYLAAIAGIDQTLYEAARMDGAGRLRQAWHITLPGIKGTIIILFILAVGGLMAGEMEKILLLYNPGIYETADIIQTYTYREGITNMNYSFGIAVGLVVSVINFFLVFISNKVSNKVADAGLW